ncbi:hypothetical protein HPB49_026680 [Dermacentor silvarum]|nr:hypothetical protein HPB49_026680 [Dermacentor silvarum]
MHVSHIKQVVGGPPKQTPEPPKRDPSERKCYSCRRYEHIATDCSKTNPAGNFMVNEDPTSDSGPSKFLKTAIINGAEKSLKPAVAAKRGRAARGLSIKRAAVKASNPGKGTSESPSCSKPTGGGTDNSTVTVEAALKTGKRGRAANPQALVAKTK